jgi:ADP-heptose:LPS heptosyltransferase
VEIKSVLICRPNKRLGNLLLMTPLVQELERAFPGCSIDLFVAGGLAPVIFENDPHVRNIFRLPSKPFKNLFPYLGVWFSLRKRRYDLAINVIEYSSSGKISTLVSRATYKLLTDEAESIGRSHPDYRHAGKYPVYALRNYLAQLGIPETEALVPALELKLRPGEIEAGRKIIRDIFSNERETIGIFTFATGPKCYPPSWWEPFYDRLKKEYPDYNILEILPKENVSQIGFKAPTFYSLDVREICAVMANLRVFIGADSGMMHLAGASGVPTIGLFSVTDETVYGPYGDGSAAVRTVNGDMGDSFEVLAKILRQ